MTRQGVPVPSDFRGFWVDVAARSVARAYNRELRPHGLTYIPFFILLLLGDGAGWRPSDLAAELRLDTSSLSGHLERLADQGLVDRVPDAGDRRSTRVRLSDAGRRRYDELAPLADHLAALEPEVRASASDPVAAHAARVALDAQRALGAIADAVRGVTAAYASVEPAADVAPAATASLVALGDLARRIGGGARRAPVLRVATLTAGRSMVGRVFERFAALVAERTGGAVRVEVDVPYATRGGGELEALVDVRSGALAIAGVTAPVAGNLIPGAQLLELPYLFASRAEAHRLIAGPFGDTLLAAARTWGLLGLAVVENGFRHLTTTDRPVHGPDDMRGLRLRVQQSPVNVYLAEALGAIAVPVPFPRLAEALRAGEIDAQENALVNVAGLELWDTQRHLTLTGHTFSAQLLLGHAETFAALGSHRATVEAAFAEAIAAHRRDAEAIERETLAALAPRLAVIALDAAQRAAWHAATRLVYQRADRAVGDGELSRLLAAVDAARAATVVSV